MKSPLRVRALARARDGALACATWLLASSVGCAAPPGSTVAASASAASPSASLAASSAPVETSSDHGLVGLLTEQVLLLATVAGAVASLPMLLEYLAERRRRLDLLRLSLEDLDLAEVPVRAAGHDALLTANADLIDCAAHPDRYPQLTVGNEVLLIGGPMSGRKSLALRIAGAASMQRVLILHNAANADALATVRARVGRARSKTMLLIPHIDEVLAAADEEQRSQLEALIEAASEGRNVLVIGTATALEPDSELDNLFGIKLLMPGVRPTAHRPVPQDQDAHVYLAAVAVHYAAKARDLHVGYEGLDETAFINAILAEVGNPAEIEDIVNLCLTSALHRHHVHGTPAAIDRDILASAIARVIVGTSGSAAVQSPGSGVAKSP